jgi:hypothetical protein
VVKNRPVPAAGCPSMRLATICPGLVCSDAEIKATVGEDMRFADHRRRGSREQQPVARTPMIASSDSKCCACAVIDHP